MLPNTPEDWQMELPPTSIAVDTETFRFSAGNLAPKLVCLTEHAADEWHPKLYTLNAAVEQAKDLLLSHYTLVLANAPYDMAVLAAADESLLPDIFRAYDEDRILDVQTWQRLYLISRGETKFEPKSGRPPLYSLEALVSYWLGESVQGKHGEDAWRMRYSELAELPADQWPAEAKEYALNDATYTMRVAKQMAQSAGIPTDLYAQCRYHFALHLMSAWGLRTDGDAVDLLVTDLDEHVDSAMRTLLEKGIYRWGGTRAAPKPVKDTKVLRQRIIDSYAARGQTPPRTEPSAKFPEGQIKLDDETLQLSQDPDLLLLAEIGSDQKLLSTYVPKLREGLIAAICPRYTPVVDTGRTSSSNPNIQNQPRKGGVRECFVPRPGFIFVDIDYNIAELRSLAQVLLDLFGESEMANIILQGKDIHCMMGASILGIEYDEFVHRLKKLHDPECKDARQMAKALDFGAPGGLGPATFIDYARTGYNVVFSEERARELIELYKSTFPEMRRYFYWMGLKSGSGNSFKLVQHRSKRIRGGLTYTNGCNTLFQGLTADGAKLAVYNVTKECYLGHLYNDPSTPSPLKGCRPVAFVHDEIMLEAPHATAQAAAARAAKVMCESMEVFTPDIPAVAEPCLMRRWYKDAEPVFDASGNLVPWAPPTLKQVWAGWAKDCGLDIEMPAILNDGAAVLDDEELRGLTALTKGLTPPNKKAPKWKQANRSVLLEQLARAKNPDPWC